MHKIIILVYDDVYIGFLKLLFGEVVGSHAMDNDALWLKSVILILVYVLIIVCPKTGGDCFVYSSFHFNESMTNLWIL